MSGTAVAGELINERKIVLAPFLGRLSELDGDGSSGAERLGFPPSFSLEPWERTALNKALGGALDPDDPWPRLVAEGLAFQALYFSQQAQPRGPAPDRAPDDADGTAPPSERQIRTAAIGLALMEEIQCVVDEKILSGKMGEVRRLTGFRNKVAQLVGEIRGEIGDEGIQQARELAREMTVPANGLPAGPEVAEEIRDKRPQMIRMDRRSRRRKTQRVARKRKRKRSRVGPLLLLLAASSVAWFVLILPRSFRVEIPVLTAGDLAFSPAIQSVTARPPSLFVVVDGRQWESMPASRREELARQVGQSAETAGYTGADFRTEEGRTVAGWSRAGGVILVERARQAT